MSVHSNSLFTQELRDRSWLRSRQWNAQYGWHKNHADAWKGTSFDKKWETAPLSTKIDQEKVKKMKIGTMIQIGMTDVVAAAEAYDMQTTDGYATDFLENMHWLVKEKEFKFGPGKEIICFFDGGKNPLNQKPMKYVKFYYVYGQTGPITDKAGRDWDLKEGNKTYTYNEEKARTLWNNKVSQEGYENLRNFMAKNPDPNDVSQEETTT